MYLIIYNPRVCTACHLFYPTANGILPHFRWRPFMVGGVCRADDELRVPGWKVRLLSRQVILSLHGYYKKIYWGF